MLAIKVELYPCGDETRIKNIGNMIIYNKGGTRESGNYGVVVLPEGMDIIEGRDMLREGRQDITVDGRGEVYDYPRLDLPVWELITEALENCGYGGTRDK